MCITTFICVNVDLIEFLLLRNASTIFVDSLNDVDIFDVFKFKNFYDSTLTGLFVPVVGEEINYSNTFELHGRGTISLRKKYNNNGAFWSIINASNVFDHPNQGKSKEVAFNNHNDSIITEITL